MPLALNNPRRLYAIKDKPTSNRTYENSFTEWHSWTPNERTLLSKGVVFFIYLPNLTASERMWLKVNFSSKLQLVQIKRFSSQLLVLPNLPYYLRVGGWEEMDTCLSKEHLSKVKHFGGGRIWSQVTDFIFFNENSFTKCV